jgi:uroporphyrinogen-III synthase
LLLPKRVCPLRKFAGVRAQRQDTAGVAYHRLMAKPQPLAGVRVAITRPVGAGSALARRVRALGGTPLLIPGSTLRAAGDVRVARETLKAALAADVVIFTSPAAVGYARQLAPLRSHACVLAPGAGTLRALRRAGHVDAMAPAREDSEGLLALPPLQNVRGKRIGIIGAPGGRGLLARALSRRGARVTRAHVYRRLPARLDRRHVKALRHDAHKALYVLLSSTEALTHILAGLPDDASHALLAGRAVVSSERLAALARKAGFSHVLHARSVHAADMLGAVIQDRPRPPPC